MKNCLNCVLGLQVSIFYTAASKWKKQGETTETNKTIKNTSVFLRKGKNKKSCV